MPSIPIPVPDDPLIPIDGNGYSSENAVMAGDTTVPSWSLQPAINMIRTARAALQRSSDEFDRRQRERERDDSFYKIMEPSATPAMNMAPAMTNGGTMTTVSMENTPPAAESTAILGDLAPVLTFLDNFAKSAPRIRKTHVDRPNGGSVRPLSLRDNDDDGFGIAGPVQQADSVQGARYWVVTDRNTPKCRVSFGSEKHPLQSPARTNDGSRPTCLDGPRSVDGATQRTPPDVSDDYYRRYAEARQQRRKSPQPTTRDWVPAHIPSESGSGIELPLTELPLPDLWLPVLPRTTVPSNASAAIVELFAPPRTARKTHLATSAPTSSHAVPSRASKIVPSSIKPLQPLSSAERRRHVLHTLIQAFPLDRFLLLSPPPPLSFADALVDDGIHVFIDCSNILIGFQNTLKKARNIPANFRVPGGRPRFDFSAFALILERGRSVAKRCMVGSDQHHPLIDEAESCGYRVEILKRVVKDDDDPARLGTRAGRRGHPQTSSGSETPSRRTRMVEQGVDEMLHLKMAESMLDAVRPATMVLASGDAAPAQYSGGFLQQVERALARGWTVEVVSFSMTMSSAYHRPAFREKWGNQFKLVSLDVYAEWLLDM